MLSLYEMDEYVVFHLKKRVWDNYENKEAALYTAENLIANLPIQGEISETDYNTAAFEIALALADGIDPEKEYRLLSQTTHAYGSVRQQKNTMMVEEYLAYGIPSMAAWKVLSKYLLPPTSVSLERIT